MKDDELEGVGSNAGAAPNSRLNASSTEPVDASFVGIGSHIADPAFSGSLTGGQRCAKGDLVVSTAPSRRRRCVKGDLIVSTAPSRRRRRPPALVTGALVAALPTGADVGADVGEVGDVVGAACARPAHAPADGPDVIEGWKAIEEWGYASVVWVTLPGGKKESAALEQPDGLIYAPELSSLPAYLSLFAREMRSSR